MFHGNGNVDIGVVFSVFTVPCCVVVAYCDYVCRSFFNPFASVACCNFLLQAAVVDYVECPRLAVGGRRGETCRVDYKGDYVAFHLAVGIAAAGIALGSYCHEIIIS